MTCIATPIEQDLAFNLESLFFNHEPRLAHMRDAAAFAFDLACCLDLESQDQNFLVRTALLHDIGYAPMLHNFSFHPLDGAIFLEKWQEHPFVVEGVLRHSQAECRAATMPLVAKEYARRRPLTAAGWLVRAVSIADWRVAGVGGQVSFGQRLQDIIRRNPDNADKARRAATMVEEVRHWFLKSMAGARSNQLLPWVFCDIDNTLTCPGDKLSEENKRAIRAYVRSGGQFSLATGKHPRSIMPLVSELGLSTAQIAANGACVLRGDEVEVLADLGETTSRLRFHLEAMGLPIAIYYQDGIEAGNAWQPWLDGLFDRYGEIRPVPDLFSGPVLKILCVVDSEDNKKEQELRALADSLNVEICRSDHHFLEFLPKKGHKGEAIRQVTAQASWPVLDSLAIGDNENDAVMFAVCGACVAVKNATETARLGADWMIGACFEDGVAQILDLMREQGGWNGLANLGHGAVV